ncbi:MAG TPA: type ISP restriction/modification enzyme [Bryobacteraceae bacterium]|nr:type ISP restriction/modification enzyme [Bryobacteraceae bacterium]
MQEEREAADRVKQEAPVLVIIGNPPYNAFAGTSPTEEEGLVEPYKEGLISEWGIKKFNLDDLYVRFFRVAERRITKTGRGVVSFISNYSWTSEPSFVVLRKRLLEGFDRFWIENLHGNRKISEYAPDGKTSETVFAMSGFSPGIRQGVVTSLWVKLEKDKKTPTRVLFRDDINAAKASDRRAQLLKSLAAVDFDKKYAVVAPDKDNRYRFWTARITKQYRAWPRVVDLCAEPPSNGLMEKRGGALIDIDRSTLKKRIINYFDSGVSWEALKGLGDGLTKNAARFVAREARKKVLAKEKFSDDRLQRYAVRPFDNQWCYYTPVRPLWNEPRPALWAQIWEGNSFFLSRLRSSSSTEGVPSYFVQGLSDDHLIMPDASCFPIRLRKVATRKPKDDDSGHLFLEEESDNISTVANLSAKARAYLKSLGFSDPDQDAETAGIIWMHALAIAYSPCYLANNADGVQGDWPRIPLPITKKQLIASATLGRHIAQLLDPECEVPGVTAGNLRKELASIGVIHREGGGHLKGSDLNVTAGWGHPGTGGITAPGKGRVRERKLSDEERAAIAAGSFALGVAAEHVIGILGGVTYDVYLNDVAYWKNVPASVWDYRIGGYQVLKKWLSYREACFLDRPLAVEEAEYVTEMARRIAAILLFSSHLNANYEAVAAAEYSWSFSSN